MARSWVCTTLRCCVSSPLALHFVFPLSLYVCCPFDISETQLETGNCTAAAAAAMFAVVLARSEQLHLMFARRWWACRQIYMLMRAHHKLAHSQFGYSAMLLFAHCNNRPKARAPSSQRSALTFTLRFFSSFGIFLLFVLLLLCTEKRMKSRFSQCIAAQSIVTAWLMLYGFQTNWSPDWQ